MQVSFIVTNFMPKYGWNLSKVQFKQLRAILIDPLLMKMDSGCSNDSYDLQLWHSWKEAGLIIIAEEFYKKANEHPFL